REAGPSARIGRVQSQSPFEVASGSHRIGLPTTIEEVAAVQVLLERLLARRVRALNLFSFFQFGMQRMSDGGSDLVLHVEDVGHIAIVGARPEMRARGAVDQLCGDANTPAGFAH